MRQKSYKEKILSINYNCCLDQPKRSISFLTNRTNAKSITVLVKSNGRSRYQDWLRAMVITHLYVSDLAKTWQVLIQDSAKKYQFLIQDNASLNASLGQGWQVLIHVLA